MLRQQLPAGQPVGTAQLPVRSVAAVPGPAFEADAACGQKTRGLEKEKPNVPCGENARQLTKDDPYPQSIYRIKSYSGKPAVAFVKLAVK